jgi:hypothetical protein
VEREAVGEDVQQPPVHVAEGLIAALVVIREWIDGNAPFA